MAPGQCDTGLVAGLRARDDSGLLWDVVQFDPGESWAGSLDPTRLGSVTVQGTQRRTFDALGLSADGAVAYFFDTAYVGRGGRPLLHRLDLSTGTDTTFTTTTRLAGDEGPGGMSAGVVDPASGIYYYAHADTGGTWWLYGWDTTTQTPIGLLGTFVPGTGGGVGDLAFDGSGNLWLASARSTAQGLWKVSAAAVPRQPSTAPLAATVVSVATPDTQGMAFIAGDGTSRPDTMVMAAKEATPTRTWRFDPRSGTVPTFASGHVPSGLTDMASCSKGVEVITLGKTITSRIGSNDQFRVTISGAAGTASATTTGSTVGAQSARATLPATPGTYTLSEAAIPAASLAGYSQTLSCVDRRTQAPVTVSGTGASRTITYAGGAVDCQWTNKARPTLTLTKTLSQGRYLPSDQFTVAIRTGSVSGPVVSSPTAATTTGTTSVVTAGTGTTGAFQATAGTTYHLTESAVSPARLSDYTSRITCTDPTGLQTGLPNGQLLGTGIPLRMVDGAQVTCTVDNVKKAPVVTGLSCDVGEIYLTSRDGNSTNRTIHRVKVSTESTSPGAVGSTTAVTPTTLAMPNTTAYSSINALAIGAGGTVGYYVANGNSNNSSVTPRLYRVDLTRPVAERTGEDLGAFGQTGMGGVVRGGINPTNGILYFSTSPGSAALHDFWAYDTIGGRWIGYVGRLTTPEVGSNGDLVFDQTGNMLLVTSSDTTARLSRISNMPVDTRSYGQPLPSTAVVTTLIPGFAAYQANGIAFDSDGYLYISFTNSANTTFIRKTDPNDGAEVAVFTVTGLGSGVYGNDLADCNDPGAIRLRKNIVERVDPASQFDLRIDPPPAGNLGNTATTGGAENGVQAAVAGPIAGVPGRVYTLTETARGGTPLSRYRSWIQCVDTTHNVVLQTTAVSQGVHRLTFPGRGPDGILADVECTYTNEPVTTVTVTKALGTSRVSATDQFSVWARTDPAQPGSELPTVAPAVRTTSGSGADTGIANNRGTTGAMPVIPGTTYHVGETGSGTTDLNQYTATITCVDARGRQPGLPDGEPYTEPVAITPVVGAQISCVITNRVVTTITLTKQLDGTRVAAADQFTVQIRYPAATVVGGSTASTTTGAGGEITVGTGVSTWTVSNPGQPVTLTEVMAGGSATAITGYDTSISCANLRPASTTVLPSGPVPAGTVPRFTVTPAAGDRIRCTLTNAATPDLATTKELVEVNGTAPAADRTVKAGDVLLYRMTVTNTGRAAGSTTLTETVPQYTTFTGSGWTGCVTDPTPSPAGTVCTRSVTVPPGESRTADFRVTVDPKAPDVEPVPAGTWLPAGAQQVVNTVSTSDGTCEACEVTTPLSPVLEAGKTLTAVNGAAVPDGYTATAGDRLTYTIAVTNTGGRPGDVTLTETVPDGTAFAGPADTWAGCGDSPATQHPGTCTWTGTVPAHDGTDAGAVAVVFEVTVLDPVPADVVEIRNVVTATDDGGTSICPGEAACTVVTPLTAAWTMTKTAARGAEVLADGATVRSGDTITYTVTATVLRGTVTGLELVDDLSGVLGAATYGSGTVTVAGGAPTPIAPAGDPAQLVVSVPTVTAPQTVVLSYTVTVKARMSLQTLRNVATGHGSVPPDRCASMTARGVDAQGCFTEQITPAYLLIQKLAEGLAGQQPVTLAGAEFGVLTDVAGTPGPAIDAPVVGTGAVGTFEVDGIAPGTYWLRELKAPAGYNLLAQDVRFTVGADGAVSTSGDHPQLQVVTLAGGVVAIQVTDTRPFTLPLTGGAGTGWIFLVGIALLLGAVVLFLPLTRRRRNEV